MGRVRGWLFAITPTPKRWALTGHSCNRCYRAEADLRVTALATYALMRPEPKGPGYRLWFRETLNKSPGLLQGLKPAIILQTFGTAEAMPLRSYNLIRSSRCEIASYRLREGVTQGWILRPNVMFNRLKIMLDTRRFRGSGLFLLCLLCLLLFDAEGTVFGQCRFTAMDKSRMVTYRFQPEVTTDGLVMHVVLEFRASASGVDTLVVPTAWAGETLHAVTNLRIESQGAAIEDGADAETKTVRSAAGRQVIVTYDLKKDWTGPLVHPLQFHPVLMPTYFEFTGSNALVRLKLDDGATERANFDWHGLPAAWTLATSFGASASARESKRGRCQTYTGPWESVEQGLYAGGDYRLKRFDIGSRPAVLAVRGSWTFTDDEASTQIAKVMQTVRSFWHDDNFPYFLVTLKPYDQEHGSSDGSAFKNAFWMYVSDKDSLGSLLPQLAHESFHAWNPMKMGRMSGTADVDTKWFKEGFTEYYAELLTYRAGELPVEKYVESLNRELRRFPPSIDEYVRGSVIALWLDATIRRESHGQRSLDDVMFDMVRSRSEPYTLARILEITDRYLSAESQGELLRAVREQGSLVAPADVPYVGGCVRPVQEDVSMFELGFDLEHSQVTHAVTGVVEGGPAFLAGLRDGQALHGISVYNNNPNRLATFHVTTAEGEKVVSFYPRGKTIAVWQYQMDGDQPCEGLR